MSEHLLANKIAASVVQTPPSLNPITWAYRKRRAIICPSSDDLRQIAGFQKGGSGSSMIEIMRHAVDAASDGLRLSGA
jgi:hypothetical protein